MSLGRTLRTAMGRIRTELLAVQSMPSQVKLAWLKGWQKEAFDQHKIHFASLYNEIEPHAQGVDAFITTLWRDFNSQLARFFLPCPAFQFLRNPIVLKTMFVKGYPWLEEELGYLKERVSRQELHWLLQEDYVGTPLIANAQYLTSHNSIHHLYHIVRFLEKAACHLTDISTVIEWGGGYGNMAKLFARLRPNITYTIVDTPLFSVVQWLYLAVTIGESKVHLVKTQGDSVQRERINFVPLCFLNSLNLNGDLFISTWALSESSKFAQDYVRSQHWFGADRLLLAWQRRNDCLPDADRVGQLAKDDGAVIEDIRFLPGNFYAFR